MGRAFHYLRLLRANLQINGMKAMAYAHGLGWPRYAEYAYGLEILGTALQPSSHVLDIGTGHSILSFLLPDTKVIALDINEEALKWQRAKAKSVGRSLLTLLGSSIQLPLKDNSMDAVTAFSTLEHFPGDGDIAASRDIFRVLAPGATAVISVPLSARYPFVTDPFMGIPEIYKKVLGSRGLLWVMRRANVDRTDAFFEKRYTVQTAMERLVRPPGWHLQECVTFDIPFLLRFLYRYAFPISTISLLDLVTAFWLKFGPSYTEGGLILKLQKGIPGEASVTPQE